MQECPTSSLVGKDLAEDGGASSAQIVALGVGIDRQLWRGEDRFASRRLMATTARSRSAWRAATRCQPTQGQATPVIRVRCEAATLGSDSQSTSRRLIPA